MLKKVEGSMRSLLAL